VSKPAPTGPARALAALGGWLLLCFLAAAAGSPFAAGPYYAQLSKPAWSPPGGVFGPVWTLLYTLMAVAAWRVARRGGWTAPGRPLAWFLLQLALNAAWTPVFFGLRAPGPALAVILLLLAAVAATLARFARVDRPAAALLAPYLAWVAFAAALNFALWRLNP
jgi:tryptophan-rich sensory protein